MITNSAFLFFILEQQKNKILFIKNYLHLYYLFFWFLEGKRQLFFLEGRLLSDVQLVVQM